MKNSQKLLQSATRALRRALHTHPDLAPKVAPSRYFVHTKDGIKEVCLIAGWGALQQCIVVLQTAKGKMSLGACKEDGQDPLLKRLCESDHELPQCVEEWLTPFRTQKHWVTFLKKLKRVKW